MSTINWNEKMRLYHRYLGYFLAGIMAVYSISGIVMIFRDTDFLKVERQVVKQLQPALSGEELGRELRLRDFKIEKENDNALIFKQGVYDKQTGKATYTVNELPTFLDKLTRLHKASTKQPLFFLNIFFGLSLLFFVVSAFYMFLPKTSVFKKGLYFAMAGVALVLVLILI